MPVVMWVPNFHRITLGAGCDGDGVVAVGVGEGDGAGPSSGAHPNTNIATTRLADNNTNLNLFDIC